VIASEQQVNLFEPIFRAERKLFASAAIAAALALLIMGLALVWGFAWRQLSVHEREIASLEAARAERVAALARAGVGFATDPAVVAARSRQLTTEITRAERALALIRRGGVGTTAGFADRLEALARPQEPGLWLTRIVFTSHETALSGATRDAAAIPRYIAALSAESAFAALKVDRLQARAADAGGGDIEFKLGDAALLDASEDAAVAGRGKQR
jgi:Tfp pilus assembly protein PilN